MIYLSNDVSYSNIGIRGTGPVSTETEKSQCLFFTLNSCRLLIKTPDFLALKQHRKKIECVNTVC